MNKKYILLPILLFSLHAFPQYQIKGILQNLQHDPIEFSEVILYKNGDIDKSALTDTLGKFNLTANKGNYRLEIRQLGHIFYTKDLELVQNTNLGTIDVENSTELKEVEVTGRRKIFRQDGEKFIFDVENSPLRRGNNGVDILRRSPKLNVNSAGDILLLNRSAIILVNGRKINLTGQDLTTYLSSINSENIKSIEIQDMTSSENEASNRGGVINIVLKRNPKGFRTILKNSYEYRSRILGKYDVGANMNYGSDKWTAYLNVDYCHDKDKVNDSGIFNYVNTSNRQESTGSFIQEKNSVDLRNGVMFYPTKRQEFGAEIFFNNSRSNFNIYDLFNVFNPSLSISSNIHSKSESETNLWYATINYTFKTDTLGSTLKFVGDMGRNNFDNLNDVSTIYTLGSNSDNLYNYTSNSVSDYYTAQLDWNYKLKSGWKWQAGAKFNSVKRDNNLTTKYLNNENWIINNDGNDNYNNRENILAGYAIMRKKIDRKHFIKLGLRVENTQIKGLNRTNNEYVKQSYIKFFPSLYYSYEINPDKVLYLSYRRNIQRPSFSELNPFVTKQNDYTYILGNPYLSPQYLQGIELGCQIKNHSLSIYSSFGQDLIQGIYYLEKGITYYKPVNIGKERIYSLDHSYNSPITKWLDANISSGVNFTSFKWDGISVSNVSFYNNIYTQIKLSKTLFFEIFNNYQHTAQYHNIIIAKNYAMDLVIQKTLLNNKAILKFTANDIFNTQRVKSTSSFEAFKFNFYQKRLTRSFMFLLQYNIDNKQKLNENTVKSDNESRQRL